MGKSEKVQKDRGSSLEQIMTPTSGFDLRTFDPPDIRQIQKKLLRLLQRNNFLEMILETDRIIEKLSTQRQTNCLVRHFLESIRRTSGVALSVQTQSSQFFTETRLLKLFIHATTRDLAKSNKIDLLAVPLQAEGLPIICQDVAETPPFQP